MHREKIHDRGLPGKNGEKYCLKSPVYDIVVPTLVSGKRESPSGSDQNEAEQRQPDTPRYDGASR
jgi:hypothetical protein